MKSNEEALKTTLSPTKKAARRAGLLAALSDESNGEAGRLAALSDEESNDAGTARRLPASEVDGPLEAAGVGHRFGHSSRDAIWLTTLTWRERGNFLRKVHRCENTLEGKVR